MATEREDLDAGNGPDPRKAAAYRRARGSRGPGFGGEELRTLLQLTETRLPTALDEWDAVAAAYNARFPSTKRTGESLRRKFMRLSRAVNVPRARRIKLLMAQRMTSDGDGADPRDPTGRRAEPAADAIGSKGGSSSDGDDSDDTSRPSRDRRGDDDRGEAVGGSHQGAGGGYGDRLLATVPFAAADGAGTRAASSLAAYERERAGAERSGGREEPRESPRSALTASLVADRWVALEERRLLLEQQKLAVEQRRLDIEERRVRLLEEKADADAAERKQLLEILQLAVAGIGRSPHAGEGC